MAFDVAKIEKTAKKASKMVLDMQKEQDLAPQKTIDESL